MTAVLTPDSAASSRSAGGTSVTRALLDVLVAWGVRRIYSCPGSTEAAVLDALVLRDDIEMVLVTHESVGVAMAEGEARATGQPAVAYLHTNVGMANGLAHLSSAELAHAPVLVLNGLKASTLAGRNAFTSVAYPRDLVRQHVKWAHTCTASESVIDDLGRALRVAVQEPAGPVWLGLPQDLLEAEIPVPVGPPRVEAAALSRPSAAALEAAAGLLAAAAHPVLVAGAEIARRQAGTQLISLAERLAAPVFNEGRRDFQASGIPTSHPLHAGLFDPTHPAVREADVLAFLGCRMFTEFEADSSTDLPSSARLVHQHTDPAEVGRLVPIDAPLVGDPALTLADLMTALSDASSRPLTEPATLMPAPARRPAHDQQFPGHVGLGPVVDALAAALDGSATTVVLDATTATIPLLHGLRTRRTGQLVSSISGSLGWGMGAALGMQLARPDQQVVALLGDGAFQFGLQALWTAHNAQVPVTFVVLNNGTYSAVASAMSRFNGAAARLNVWPGTDIAGLDISAAARAFGIPAVRVDGARDLMKAVSQAMGQSGPLVVEVLTGPAAPPTTKVDPAVTVQVGGRGW